MGAKKEIGEIFATQLKDGKKSPSKEAWHRLESSLDRQKQIRKRNLLYWFSGGASFLLGVYLLLGTNILSTDSPLIQTTPPSEEESLFSIDKNSKNQNDDFKTVDTIGILPVEADLSHSTSDPEDASNQKIQKELQDYTTTEKAENTKAATTNSPSMDDTYKVVKRYYYYNSEDGKQLVTDSKEKIDSLIYKTNDKSLSIPKQIPDSTNL